MKAFWMVDDTAISQFDSLEEAISELDLTKKNKYHTFPMGDATVTVETSHISIATEEEMEWWA